MDKTEQKNPFGELDFHDKQLLYKGLVALVKSNSGLGFHNSDQGHPAYAIGREGNHDYKQWGDSPEHNRLFKFMHTLSVDLCEAEIDDSSEISEYIFTWSDFCSMAYEAYEKHKG
jgi:hypothetical protein